MINELTELLFRDIPISKQTIEAKKKIAEVLDRVYMETLDGHNEIEAMGIVMSKYNNINKAGKLAGYSKEEINNWLGDKIITLAIYKKKLVHLKALNYIGFFSFICAIIYFINCFTYRFPLNLVFCIICLGLGILSFGQGLKIKRKIYTFSLSSDSSGYIISEHDKYVKKTINTIIFVIAYTAYLLVIAICLFEFKYPETVQYTLSKNIIIEICIFLLLKNIFMLRFYNYYCHEKIQLISKHIKTISILAVLYFSIILVGINFIVRKTEFVLNIYYILVVLAAVLVIWYNFTLRKKLVVHNSVINKKRITIIALCVIFTFSFSFMKMDFWIMQPYISSVPSLKYNESKITYEEKSGIYSITKSEDDFKILQLTDIHLGGSVFSYRKDHKALEAARDLIEYTNPDFVIVTGDLVFPLGVMSYSFNNETPIMEFASFMRNIGIPWGFVYGNHESEKMATSTSDDLNELFKSLSYKTSKTLLYPYVQPDITGRNNQIIKICNEDGSLNQALFLVDSNDYISEGINDYDYIHDDQVEWYRENVEQLKKQYGENISSMAFFHIPLQEYRTANELYENGDSQVKYFFGEIGETMNDKICCSDYPSNFFDTAVALKSTKAMFCGHDHYNNISLEYKGIRLTYGMSIDFLAMPGIENDINQRGGTLITLHEDSTFDIKQVKLMDIQ